MLEKPDIPDENIITCIKAEYGLQVSRLMFLPVGGDLSTAVYRAATEDETTYFCKLKLGGGDETSVTLPKYLRDQASHKLSLLLRPKPISSGEHSMNSS